MNYVAQSSHCGRPLGHYKNVARVQLARSGRSVRTPVDLQSALASFLAWCKDILLLLKMASKTSEMLVASHFASAPLSLAVSRPRSSIVSSTINCYLSLSFTSCTRTERLQISAFAMQPPSDLYNGHTAFSVPNVPQPQPASSELSSHAHDSTSSQATRLPADPYAFSRIGHGQQMTSDVRYSAPPNSYQQHLEQRTPFGVPTMPAIPSQPWLMTAPPIGNNVPSNSTVPQSPSHPSAFPAVSSYDPALNDAYLRFFNDDRAEL
ncbi:hypothetical protein EVG20_g10046, partial [Dentipellis fragilis]